MKSLSIAAALLMSAGAAIAAPERYTLDASHSQLVFSYEHLGFSTTYGMFSGFEGEIMFDQGDPTNSSVTVSMPARSMLTGWEGRFEHFMGDDFFGADDAELITFASTSIDVTGDNTAKITGALTVNEVTKEVVLDAKMNNAGQNPMSGKAWAGFDATTTILRSDFNLGAFAPAVSDEIEVLISIEAGKAE